MSDLAVTVAGDAVTWPSGSTDGAAHQVRMILFGDASANSTDGTSNPPTDSGWWITALQDYYANGPAPVAATANPVNGHPDGRACRGRAASSSRRCTSTAARKGKIMLSLSVAGGSPDGDSLQAHGPGHQQRGIHVEEKSKIVIQPGQSEFVVKIKPRAGTTLGGEDGKKVKLLLEPGDGYVVGTPTPLKVKIRVD